jgi:glutathione synthase/RimK-type ligase-like ATP-grasp enzyme
MKLFDITLITDSRYVNPSQVNWYIQNILDDDRLVTKALEKRGLTVTRTNWDNPDFDWTKTRYAIFRTTWDYFDRFTEFAQWLKKVSTQTQLINPIQTIWWNIDKHYLSDLNKNGVHIPPTLFIETNDQRSLAEIVKQSGWTNCILKPAVSGSARHTYRLNPANIMEHEGIFKELIKEESMLLQEFQHQITTKGEVALMVFGGKFSHAVLKKAKAGDFRVQDDFGGSVHEYTPTIKEIKFAEEVASKVSPLPAYARVDLIWDNNDELCVSELELIEPELWFRKHLQAAELFAEAVLKELKQPK